MPFFGVSKARLAKLLAPVEQGDCLTVRQLLRETISGYSSDGDVVDWIYS